MSENELFDLTKSFIETKPACSEALKQLKPGVEIQISLEKRQICCCGFANGRAYFESRPANDPDVEFIISSETMRRLSNHPGTNLAELGVEICREILAGTVELKLMTGVMKVIANGYLNVVKAAGPTFMSYLAQHGLSRVDKIVHFVRSMKS